ncbi:MAG: recombinase family protein [Firmicutes bacterium]|nr:recombinase family protein [Bacillota bacterium]
MSICVLLYRLEEKIINSDTLKVGMYLRLSREDEIKNKESESIENQRKLIENYCQEKGFIIFEEYVDDGVSGTTFERPGFTKMIEDAKNGIINTIITKDLSRLGRNFAHFTIFLDEVFPKYNIRFIAISDNFDTKSYEIGGIETYIKNMMNEQFAKDISNKVKGAIYTKKRNGEFLGGVPPYGYKKDPNNKYKLIIDEDTSIVVKRIFNMFINGYSLKSIADILTDEKIPIPSVKKNLNRGLKSSAYGIWCTRTLSEMLNNPTYTGNLTQCRRRKVSYKSKEIKRTPKEQWIIVENTHEPIIDTDTFNIAQSLFKKNIGRNSHDILLKGFLYCKECKHTISICKGGNGKYYCSCNFYKKHSKRGLCTPHSCTYKAIEERVLKEIRKLFKQYLKRERFEDIAKNSNKREKKLFELKSGIEHSKNKILIYKSQIDEAYRDKLRKKIDEEQYVRTSEMIIKDIDYQKKLLQDLEHKYNCLLLNIPNEEDYSNLITEYLSLKKPNRQILASIIDKIEIDEEKNLTIHCKIRLD